MQGQSSGQNEAASVYMERIEQGMQVYTSIYKRVYSSMAEEFRKLYRLNKKYLNMQESYGYATGESAQIAVIMQADYSGSPTDVLPVADPNIISAGQRIARAEALMMRVAQAPHLYGFEGALEAERRFLEAMQIQGVEQLLSKAQPPQNQEAQMQAQLEQDNSQREWFKAQMDARRTMANISKDKATIVSKMASIQDQRERTELEELKLAIEAYENEVSEIYREFQHRRDQNTKQLIAATKARVDSEKAKQRGNGRMASS